MFFQAALATLFAASGALAGVIPSNSYNTTGVETVSRAAQDNNQLWEGKNGRFRLHMKNNSPSRIVVKYWVGGAGFLNGYNPQPTVFERTMDPQAYVVVSTADHLEHVGFSAIYPDTRFEGQIYNTWGEFSVTDTSVINVSREPWMKGHRLEIKTPTGCIANMDRCAFVCTNGKDRCGEKGEYDLIGCNPGDQPWTNKGWYNGAPSGGCGMGNDGDLAVDFY
jgi:hypothetical protein